MDEAKKIQWTYDPDAIPPPGPQPGDVLHLRTPDGVKPFVVGDPVAEGSPWVQLVEG